MLESKHTSVSGFDKKRGKFTEETRELTPASEYVLRLEAALSGVQTVKHRAIEGLRTTIKENPQNSGGLQGIVDAIDRSAKAFVQLEEAERDLDATVEGL